MFFGGYRASETDMKAWKTSALAQDASLNIETFAWNEGASASTPVPHFHQGPGIVKRIKDAPDVTFVLVGHSSGCALVNDVAEKCLEAGASNFRLVCLDGFRPSKALLAHPGTAVWSAEWENHLSLNYHALQSAPCFRVFHPPHCTHLWSLHFSLVNRASTDIVVDGILHGYRDCVANLDVLNTAS